MVATMTHFNYFYEFLLRILSPFCGYLLFLIFLSRILCGIRERAHFNIVRSFIHATDIQTHTDTKREDKNQCRNLCILCLLIINSM